MITMRRRWTGDRLARLKADYEAGTQPLRALASTHNISAQRITQYSRKFNWTPRRPGQQRLGRNFDQLPSLIDRRRRVRDKIKALNQELHQLDRRIFAVQAANPENPLIDEGEVNP